MGGGASNLSSEQILAVTKALKEKIDAMPSDLNGTSIQQSSVDEVIKLYTDTLETFNQVPEVKKCSPGFLQQFLAPLPEQSPKISKENASKKSELSLRMSASLPHYAQNITRSTRRSIDLSVKSPMSSNGRRRSFAVNPAKKRRMSTATLSVDSDTVNKAISDLVLSTAPSIDANDFSEQQPPIDSWESVSQQPFCTICQMTFKSMAFLDRHTKYSDIHAKTLAKSQQTNTESLNNAMAQPSIQEEGVHYQLLYHGTKFFWKQQKSIDFDIYLHILPNVYEVVAFDVEKHRELSRLYLDSVSVDQIIEQTLQEAVAEKRKELSKDRFKVLPTEFELRNDMKRNIIITNILQRLQLHTDIASKMFEIGLVFVLQSDDACVNNPALDRPPAVLIPVAGLTRRRKSTTSEINSAIAGEVIVW